MNHRTITLIAALATSFSAMAVTNEAVKTVNGKVVVELPPTPKMFSAEEVKMKYDPWRPGVLTATHVIQTTATDFVECPRSWVDSTCRPYLKGRDQRRRAFIIKNGGQWIGCPRQNSLHQCRPLSKGAFMELQD
jgi:hypothetical protein